MPILLGAGAIGMIVRPLPVLGATLVALAIDHWI
jgi:hypothetical protein